ncbi:acylneuraminate cytidylyltransferase family protein [Marinobacter lipolyticus]|uniref:acylneuraminate cytidylyltransferase family protein n=1 Tax=Marinobacter lipolyticus TaxID=209639 RepID=UPI0016416866|nr:acylneuraminate cytidylyltransferase family protein [Marinobacter lipolyticus]
MTVTCFLPCRKGSERVPRKNIRPIGDKPYGLLQIKLEQLFATKLIDRVILSTNDEEIIEYAKKLEASKLDIRLRDDALASSSTSTDELIQYAGSQIEAGHILWTHVTSPFLTATLYDAMIEKYLAQLECGYDSLMSVNELRGFIWDESRPVNYDRSVEKWPRTQTLSPLYEINSGVFLAPAEVYQLSGDRIGDRPYKYVLDKIQGFDIDWEEDFLMADAMLSAGICET